MCVKAGCDPGRPSMATAHCGINKTFIDDSMCNGKHMALTIQCVMAKT